MKKKIAIIFGGRSSEHEVSIRSAYNILKALNLSLFEPILIAVSKQGTWYQITEKEMGEIKFVDDQKNAPQKAVSLVSFHGEAMLIDLQNFAKQKIDCAFPIIHGTNGEDGALQGLLKMANVPFVGCGVMSSAVAMDKEAMKIVMTAAGIKNAKYAVLKSHEKNNFTSIKEQLGLPFFIKPANAGSSVGVHKIKTESDFESKLKDAFQYDHKVLAEEFIEGREIECSVMGLNQNPKAGTPGELIVKHEFYSYEAKYLDDNGAEIIIPAKTDVDKIEEIRKLAIKTYKALFCDGLTRVDFFMKKDGTLYVNEINTLPGFTKISMYPMMWEASGLKYSDLITELINFAFAKFEYENQLKMTYL